MPFSDVESSLVYSSVRACTLNDSRQDTDLHTEGKSLYTVQIMHIVKQLQ